jgi:hypothetical protein
MRHACKEFWKPRARKRTPARECDSVCVGGGCNFRRETQDEEKRKQNLAQGQVHGVFDYVGIVRNVERHRVYRLQEWPCALTSHQLPHYTHRPLFPRLLPSSRPFVAVRARRGLSIRCACGVRVLACCLSFTLHYFSFHFSFLFISLVGVLACRLYQSRQE